MPHIFFGESFDQSLWVPFKLRLAVGWKIARLDFRGVYASCADILKNERPQTFILCILLGC